MYDPVEPMIEDVTAQSRRRRLMPVSPVEQASTSRLPATSGPQTHYSRQQPVERDLPMEPELPDHTTTYFTSPVNQRASTSRWLEHTPEVERMMEKRPHRQSKRKHRTSYPQTLLLDLSDSDDDDEPVSTEEKQCSNSKHNNSGFKTAQNRQVCKRTFRYHELPTVLGKL